MKYEIKIDFTDESRLKEVVQNTYFGETGNGKILKNKDEFFFSIEDSNSIILKGLNNMTVRVINNNQIDGFLRCSVREEENGIYLTPCNIYCIIDNGKYSFY